jgi:hypothetical protein
VTGHFAGLRTHLKKTEKSKEFFPDLCQTGGRVTSLFLGLFHFKKRSLITKPSSVTSPVMDRDCDVLILVLERHLKEKTARWY